MKLRIMSAAISRDASSAGYRIEPEHSECEHGYEWGDDVLGYADNATQSDWEYDYEAIPASAYEGDPVDFGSATGTNFVFVVRSDGDPVSAYWLSDCQP